MCYRWGHYSRGNDGGRCYRGDGDGFRWCWRWNDRGDNRRCRCNGGCCWSRNHRGVGHSYGSYWNFWCWRWRNSHDWSRGGRCHRGRNRCRCRCRCRRCSQRGNAQVGRIACASRVNSPLGVDSLPGDFRGRTFLPEDEGQLTQKTIQWLLVTPGWPLHGDGQFWLAPGGCFTLDNDVDLFCFRVGKLVCKCLWREAASTHYSECECAVFHGDP